MFNPFARKYPDPVTPWAQAGAFRDAGYWPLPIECSAVERGPNSAAVSSCEQPQFGGWAWGLGEPPSPDQYCVGIHAGILPREGGATLAEARATWLTVLRISGLNKRTSRAVREIIGQTPTRVAVETGDILVPYAVPDTEPDPRNYGFRTGTVSCMSGPVCFAASGPAWTWQHGYIADMPRRALRSLTVREAAALVDTLAGVLSKAAA